MDSNLGENDCHALTNKENYVTTYNTLSSDHYKNNDFLNVISDHMTWLPKVPYFINTHGYRVRPIITKFFSNIQHCKDFTPS